MVDVTLADGRMFLMVRLLIFEPDAGWRQRLLALLRRAGNLETTMTANKRDACLALGDQPFDLAILAAAKDGRSLARTLRIIQGDLRVVLLVEPETDPGIGLEGVQGTVLRDDLANALLPVLRKAMNQRVKVTSNNRQGPLTLGQMRDIVAGVGLPAGVDATILANGHGLAAHQGFLSERQAVALATIVATSWDEETFPTQISQLPIPGKPGIWRLCALRLGETFYALVLARPESPLPLSRQMAARLARQLDQQLAVIKRSPSLPPTHVAADAGIRSPEVGGPFPSEPFDLGDRDSSRAGTQEEAAANGSEATLEGRPAPSGTTFAIAWRSLSGMPVSLRPAVRDTLEQISQAHACQIHFLDIAEELVHLVVTCPQGQSSLWLSDQFKQGSEDRLKHLYNLREPLWSRGYYARRSVTPLPIHELSHFLEQNRSRAD